MVKRSITLLESVYQDGSPQVDRDSGVIRDVKILGTRSRNKGGYEYSPAAQRQACTLYEGMKVNTNHPSRSTPNASRGIEDGIGWLKDCKVVDGKGVYGDLHVLKSHPMAGLLFEAAERNPSHLGLSHNASGLPVERGGRRIVESLECVRSVDLVGKPATNNSLFESEDIVADRTVKDILESLEAGPNKSRLIELMEMDGMPFDAGMAVPATEAEGESDPFADVIRSGLLAIWDDASLDLQGKKDKIAKLLDISGDLANDASGDGSNKTSEEDKTVTESLREELDAVKAELADSKAEKACRTLLESASLAVTDKRIRLLKSVKPDTRKDLIEEWQAVPKPKPQAQRPATSRPVPLVESEERGTQSGGKPAKGAKEMRAAYR